MNRLAIVGLALVVGALPVAAQTKYTATVIADKATDFTKLKTYVWQSGWDANDKKVHAQIVAAVDRELKTLGFTLKSSGPADVVVKYAALRRIDVDVSMKAEDNPDPRRIDVGSLLVSMLLLDPASGKELFRARLDKPIELDPRRLDPRSSRP